MRLQSRLSSTQWQTGSGSRTLRCNTSDCRFQIFRIGTTARTTSTQSVRVWLPWICIAVLAQAFVIEPIDLYTRTALDHSGSNLIPCTAPRLRDLSRLMIPTQQRDACLVCSSTLFHVTDRRALLAASKCKNAGRISQLQQHQQLECLDAVVACGQLQEKLRYPSSCSLSSDSSSSASIHEITHEYVVFLLMGMDAAKARFECSNHVCVAIVMPPKYRNLASNIEQLQHVEVLTFTSKR